MFNREFNNIKRLVASFFFVVMAVFCVWQIAESSYLPTTGSNIGIGTTTPVGALTVMSGNVGVGTWSPTHELQVVGTVAATAFTGDGAGLTNIAGTNSGWTDGGTNVYTSTTTDNVGIGTTTPNAATLEVVKNAAQPAFKVSSAAAGNGDYLNVNSAGNVGIGTITPTFHLVVVEPGTVAEASATLSTAAQLGSTISVQGNGQAFFMGRDSTNNIEFLMGTSAYGYATAGSATSHDFRLRTANLDRITLTSGGVVGIGTVNPVGGFVVVENTGTDNSFRVNDAAMDSSPFVIDAGGNVGIGTTTPSGMLDVRQGAARIWTGAGTDTNATSAGELYVEGDLEVDGTIYGDGSGLTSLPSTVSAGGWLDGGTNVYTSTTTDNVGIGTTTPTATLLIENTTTGDSFRINDALADSSPLVVTSNGNVGIGTTVPNRFLDVRGVGAFRSAPWTAVEIFSSGGVSVGVIDTLTGTRYSSANGYDVYLANSSGNGIVVKDTSANVGIGTFTPGGKLIVWSGNVGLGTTTPVDGLSIMNGNVGIGTWSPIGQLEVKGGSGATRIWTGSGTDTNATSAGELYVEGDLEVDGTLYGDGSGLTGASQLTAAGGWTDGGSNLYLTTTTDNVAIGTTTPASTLTVLGNIGLGTTLPYRTIAGPNNGMIVEGNVGIGTWNPSYRLHVTGGTLAVDSGSGTDTLRIRDASITKQAGTFLTLNSGMRLSSGFQIVIGAVSVNTNIDRAIVSDGKFSIYTNSYSNEALYLSSGGNVGLSTSDPVSRLVINGGVGIGSLVSSSFITTTAPSGGLIVEKNVGIGTTTAEGALVIMNGNVGVGTWLPADLFEVKGSLRANTTRVATLMNGSAAAPALRVNQSDTGWFTPVAQAIAFSTAGSERFRIDSLGSVGIGTTTPVGALTVMNGNVGIGTWSPIGQLEVKGGSGAARIWTGSGTDTNATSAGELYVEGDLEVDGTIYGDGSGLTSLPSTVSAGGWLDGGTNVYTSTTTDNVGIGTTTPNAATLEIVKNAAQPALKISSSATGSGDFLVVDSQGNVGIGTTLTTTVGLSIMNGNVGIGTWSPIAPLTVINTTSGGSGGIVIMRPGVSTQYLSLSESTTAHHWIAGAGSKPVVFTNADATAGSGFEFDLGASLPTSGTRAMSIVNGGNVGIGTISPQAKLEVDGNVSIGTAGGGDRTFTINSAATNKGFSIVTASSATTFTGITANQSLNIGPQTNTLFTDIDFSINGNSFGDFIFRIANMPRVSINTSGNLGVGTYDALSRLIVNGGVGIGTLSESAFLATAAPVGGLIVEKNVGIGTTTPVGALTVMNGNVGIGTWSPIGQLEVKGGSGATRIWTGSGTDTNATSAGELYVEGDLEVDGTLYGDGSGLTGTSQLTAAGGWTDGGTSIYLTTTTDNVAIGTTTPASTLTVLGNIGLGTTLPYRTIAGPNNGMIVEGNVGIGTWKATDKLIVLGGNVGIGTTVVDDALEVNGTVQIGSQLKIGQTSNPYLIGGGVFKFNSSINNAAAARYWQFNNANGAWLDAGNYTQQFFSVNPNYAPSSSTPQTTAIASEVVPTFNPSSVAPTVTGQWVSLRSTGTFGSGDEVYNAASPMAGVVIDPTFNVGSTSSGGYTALLVNPTETSLSATANNLLADFQAGSVSKFVINNSGNVGVGTFRPVGALTIMSGNVGIGTWSPTASLQVVGTVSATAFSGDGSALTNLPASGGWTDGGANVSLTTDTDRVGIGTTLMAQGTSLSIMTGNVGIGTWNAVKKLEVFQSGNATSDLRVTNSNRGVLLQGDSTDAVVQSLGTSVPLTFKAGNANNSNYIFSSTGGVAIGTSTPVGALTVMSGNVGIGTWSPIGQLEVKGGSGATRIWTGSGTDTNATSAGELYVEGDLEVDGTIYGDGSGLTALPSTVSAGGWLDGGTNVYTSTTTDNVGIGTTTPNAATLEIVKNAAQPALKVSSSATGNGDFLVVNSQGNVGIGTFVPEKLFHIKGAAGYLAKIQASSSVDNDPALLGFTVSGAGSYEAGYVGAVRRPADSGGVDLVFGANTGGGAPSEKMRIFGNGNVGIGTTTASEVLTVNGNIFMPGSRTIYQGTSNTLQLGWSSGGPVFLVSGSSTSSHITFSTQGNNAVRFLFNNDERMRVTNTGNVGVGTYNPVSKMVVNGGVGIGTLSESAFLATAAPVGGLIVEKNVGIGTTTPVGGLTVMNGNVGIGTWSPDSGKLIVLGGNIGLGTSSPLGIVSIFGTDPATTSEGLLNIEGTARTNVILRPRSSFAQLSVQPYAANLPFFISNSSGPLVLRADADTEIVRLTGGNVGVGTTTPVGGLVVLNGKVGIGTWSPIGQLEVKGGSGATRIWTGSGTDTNATSAGELYVEGDLEVDGTLYGDGSGLTGASQLTAAGGWTDGGTNVYTSTTTDNVGIGTTTPNAATLEIVKNAAQPALKVSSSATGGGDYFLISSAGNVGIGTNNLGVYGLRIAKDTQYITTSSGNTYLWMTAGKVSIGGSATPLSTLSVNNNLFVGDHLDYKIAPTNGIAVVGNVGMGTITPSNQLSVNGAVGIGTVNSIYVNTAVAPPGGMIIEGNVGIGTTAPRGALTIMNGNVGIGTTDPSYNLMVVGSPTNTYFGGTLLGGAGGFRMGVSNSGYVEFGSISGTPVRIIESATSRVFITGGNVGIGTTTPVGALTVMNGNVGIGTWSPTHDLQVVGTVAATAFSGDGSALTNLPSSGGWTDGGTNVYTSTTTDNVGIGTTTPNAATLEVVKNAGQPALKVSSSATGGGDFLIVDSTGNVGIGTLLPQFNLDVNGSTAVRFLANSSTPFAIGNASNTIRMQIYTTGPTIRFLGNTNAYSPFAGKALSLGNNFGGISAPLNGAIIEGNVGIGTQNPGSLLSVNGGVSIGSNTNFVNGSAAPTDGLMVQGNVGIGTTAPAGALTVMNGNVGIGTVLPSASLAISGGNLLLDNNFYLNIKDDGATIRNVLGVATNGAVNLYGYHQNPILQGGNGVNSFYSGSSANTNVIMAVGQNGVTINKSGATVSASNVALAVLSGNVGVGTTAPVGALTVMNGNVGVGTWSPTQALQVVGTVAATAFSGDGSGLTGISAGGWTDGGTNVYTSTTTDNVGIGTTTPNAATLEVVQTAAQPVLKVSSAPGQAGDYLIITSNGNVGIGNAVPLSTLDVKRNSATVTDNTTHWNGSTLVLRNYNNTTNNSAGITFWGGVSGNSVTGISSINEVADSLGALAFFTGGAGVSNTVPERVRITSNGNVGIGTSTPVAGLSVMNGNVGIGTWSPTSVFHIKSDATYPTQTIESTTTSGGDLMLKSSGGSYQIYLQSADLRFLDSSGVDRVSFLSGGNVGIGTVVSAGGLSVMNGNVGIGTWSPTQKLHVVGNLLVQGSTSCTLGNGAGATNCSSDIRLKENVHEIKDALNKIQSIRAVEFDWNDKALKPGRHDIGVIAQDVEKVFPTTVIEDANGYKMLDYAVLVSPLIEAVKELNQTNQSQAAALEVQKKDIDDLKKENQRRSDQLKEILGIVCRRDPDDPSCQQELY